MEAQSKPRHSWVRIGATYGAVVSEKIVALVYHSQDQRGEVGGPGGEQVASGPAWFLVWTDEPHRHFQLSATAATPDMPLEKLDQLAVVALTEAGNAIEGKLGQGGD